MAFIAPKTLAHRVAEGIAQGYNADKAVDGAEKAEVCATAEAIMLKLAKEAAAEAAAAAKTPAGLLKAKVAYHAAKARMALLALADEGKPQTEQSRKGFAAMRRKLVPAHVANELRQALIANRQDPRDFAPVDGKPTKSAPGAVVTLNLLSGIISLAARPKLAAAKG